VIIAIPSKGRPMDVKSTKVLTSAVLFVPEAEVPDYRKGNPKTQIVGVPARVRGITATRNWILDNAKDRWVVMADDDLMAQGYVKLHAHNGEVRKLTEAEWIGEIVKLFEITEQMKLRIWGVATQAALRAVYPWKPILFRSYVTASFMGIVNDGRTRFDERFIVKEDYELNLRCIKEDGGIVAARYLFWQNTHWTDPGGCADYRTQIIELRCIKLLSKLYPGMIRRVTRGGSHYSINLEF
jgi:glycosyltransferase involved in cell wall biosynthesis